MAVDKNVINPGNTLLTARFMPRPRVDAIFDQQMGCKLIYVVAGAGYGKTQTVLHYIKQQPDAVVRWIQLTESDNIGFRFWESLTHSVSTDNPDLAAKLRESGFPGTPARFKQFAEILKSLQHNSHKSFLVLDDFHVIHSRQVLAFAQRCAQLQIPGTCVIIISRKEPEINAASLFTKGLAGIIGEDVLRFTESEIAGFFKQSGVPFSNSELPHYARATNGWAHAVKLLSLIVLKTPGNLEYALSSMKQNVFKLMDVEAWGDLTKQDRKSMVRLSLVANLPITPIEVNSGNMPFLLDSPQLASFVWYDSLIGDYRIHPLYLEFLQSKANILSDEEKQETYLRAAKWCDENRFYTDAISLYAKSRQYSRMLEILLSYPLRLPYDTCEYFLGVLHGLDQDNSEKDDHSVLLLKNLFIPLLLVGMDKYDEAIARSSAFIKDWECSDSPISSYMLYIAYCNLAYAGTYTCTATHKYDFLEHLEKALHYYKLSSTPPVRVTGAFAVADVRSFACLVGEGAALPEVSQFLEISRKTAGHIAETYHNMYYGYDDLVACELAFFRNQPAAARGYAHDAIIKAREKNQYSIEAMAEHYLLRIAVQEGDYPLTQRILKQLRKHLSNSDFWNRQLQYDLISGFFYSQIGLPDMVPAWLVVDEKDTTSEIHIPVRELVVHAKCLIASQKYEHALTVLCKSYPRQPHERFLLGELKLSLLTAVARLQTGDTPGSVKDFDRAYGLSLCGDFEMPFIELGKELGHLANVVLKQTDCAIKRQWLNKTSRKASAYAKYSAYIMALVKKDLNIDDAIQITKREQELLYDLYRGLSREEIAATRHISISTVKTILNSVYTKLDAGNTADVIRIAVEKKLV